MFPQRVPDCGNSGFRFIFSLDVVASFSGAGFGVDLPANAPRRPVTDAQFFLGIYTHGRQKASKTAVFRERRMPSVVLMRTRTLLAGTKGTAAVPVADCLTEGSAGGGASSTSAKRQPPKNCSGTKIYLIERKKSFVEWRFKIILQTNFTREIIGNNIFNW